MPALFQGNEPFLREPTAPVRLVANFVESCIAECGEEPAVVIEALARVLQLHVSALQTVAGSDLDIAQYQSREQNCGVTKYSVNLGLSACVVVYTTTVLSTGE